jgi:hypothetical protein
MWLLDWIPDTIIHLIVIAGILGIVASFFMGFIPFINTYKLPIQIICIILLTFGVYSEGIKSEKAEWELKVKEMQVKVAEAETKSSELNTQISEQLNKNIKLNEDVKNAQNKVIEKIITKYDSKCELPNATIRLHDSSSQNEIPGSASNSDGDPSNVKESDLIRTVTVNYSTYYEMRDKLLAWQEWYTKNKQLFEEAQQ